MKTTIIIPGVPYSDNRYKGRENTAEYRRHKAEWTHAVSMVCHRGHKHPGKVTLTLEYHFSTNRRRDPDNYSGKFILDGLVKAGIIKDDNFEYITLQLRGVNDAQKGRERVVVTIEDE